MNIPILYEDDDIIAIDKPAGIMAHGDGRPDNYTIADWFVDSYLDSRDVGEEPIETQKGEIITRPGIVHRLDRDTSGVMLLAKTTEGHTHLKQQFQNHRVTKTYHAIVYGEMRQDSYVVDSPIGRAKTFGRWTAIPKAVRGTTRDAETQITVVKRFTEKNEPYSYVEAQPKTGRTHQIRVHLQYLNYPIVADALYAGKRNDEKKNLGFDHQALHAKSLVFSNLEGERRTIESPEPELFRVRQ